MTKTTNNNGNWKTNSISWNIAQAIVGRDASHTAIRRVQLKVAYPLMLVVWVVAVYIGFLALVYGPSVATDCTYTECHCYEGYDSFGKWHNDNPYNYHCIEHGDGHDCY